MSKSGHLDGDILRQLVLPAEARLPIVHQRCLMLTLNSTLLHYSYIQRTYPAISGDIQCRAAFERVPLCISSCSLQIDTSVQQLSAFKRTSMASFSVSCSIAGRFVLVCSIQREPLLVLMLYRQLSIPTFVDGSAVWALPVRKCHHSMQRHCILRRLYSKK
jgi:hypothetical protein